MKGCAGPCSRLPSSVEPILRWSPTALQTWQSHFERTHRLIRYLIHVKAPNFSGQMITFTNEHMPQCFDTPMAVYEGG